MRQESKLELITSIQSFMPSIKGVNDPSLSELSLFELDFLNFIRAQAKLKDEPKK
jgi:hypothetical protein